MNLNPTTIIICGVGDEVSTIATHTVRGTWSLVSVSFVYVFIDFYNKLC